MAFALASGLIDSHELAAAVEASGVQHREPDAVAQFAEYLVANGTLTGWQCDKISNGQYKGFFLGQFRILEVDPESEAYHYFAEDLQSGKRVRLLVKPNRSYPDGLEYGVIE